MEISHFHQALLSDKRLLVFSIDNFQKQKTSTYEGGNARLTIHNGEMKMKSLWPLPKRFLFSSHLGEHHVAKKQNQKETMFKVLNAVITKKINDGLESWLSSGKQTQIGSQNPRPVTHNHLRLQF